MRSLLTTGAEVVGATLIVTWAQLAFDAGLLVAGVGLLFVSYRWSR